MRETKFRKVTTLLCLALLIIIMLIIFARTVTRQVLVKALGINNIVTELILFDNVSFQEAGLGEGVGIDGLSDKKISIDWAQLYPFDEISSEETQGTGITRRSPFDKYTGIVGSITGSTDYYTSKFLPAYDYLVERYQIYREIINWELKEDAETDEIAVINMENGCLTYSEPYRSEEEITEMADCLADFNAYLSDKQIPFYYVNAGSKVNPDDKQLSALDINREFSNENADHLLEALSERNINAVDMRALMKADGLDWYSSYYITDHHWTNKTGMWAAGKIANLLNQNEGFAFDDGFFDINNYNVTEYTDFWTGGQAAALNHVGFEKESFSVIIPNFDTAFDVEVPSKDYHETGCYDEVLFTPELFAEITDPNADKYATDKAYHLIRWTNDPLGIIINLNPTNNDGKKLLILADSFSWYAASYLACDVSEIDLINPMSFDGSIRAYIEQTGPDIVLLMYGERNIWPIDLSTHKSQFDMR